MSKVIAVYGKTSSKSRKEKIPVINRLEEDGSITICEKTEKAYSEFEIVFRSDEDEEDLKPSNSSK